jgi:hypothetical protein
MRRIMKKISLVTIASIILFIFVFAAEITAGTDLNIIGTNPSISVLPDDHIALVCNKNSFLHFYKLNSGMEIVTDEKLFKGSAPSITTLPNGYIALAYATRDGSGYGDNILNIAILNDSGNKLSGKDEYIKGYNPNITALPNGDIAEVHKVWNAIGLCFLVIDEKGKIIEKNIYNKKGGKFPAIALLENGKIAEVHLGRGNSSLYYMRLEQDGEVKIQSKKYDSNAEKPSIIAYPGNKIFEVHGSSIPITNRRLWYNILTENGVRETNKKYDIGISPAVVKLNNGKIIEVHEGPGKKLWYKEIVIK